MKISCCMILGNSTAELIRTLQSIEGFVDEFCFLVTRDDTGSTEKTINIFKGMTDVPIKVEVDLESYLYEDKVPKSFADMRNKNFEMASHEIICWFDSDDIVVTGCPEEFKSQVLKDFEEFDLDGIHGEYDYEIGSDGRVLTRQMRERFLRKGKAEWRSPLHENACYIKRPNMTFYRRDVFHVVHKRPLDEASIAAQTLRNRLVIERFIADNPDYEIRLDFYYGHILLDSKEYEKAIEHYDRYLAESGFPEERYLAYLKKAACYRGLNQHKKAIATCFEAIDQNPEWSEAYSDLAESYMVRKEWVKVIMWTAEAMKKAVETPRRGTVWNPVGVDVRPRYMMRQACIELGQWVNAQACNNALMQLYPGVPDLEDMAEKIQCEIDFMNAVKIHDKVLSQLPEERKSDYVKDLEPELQRYGPFGKLLNYNDLRGEKRSIAFFCGEAVEHWGPSSVEKGIGGSEEAVINISRIFANMGWHVEVFCNASEVGVIDGVVWRDWTTLNPKEYYDIFVIWRIPQFTEAEISCGKKYLWLHDIQEEAFYSEKTLDSVDRIFVLSQFHRDTVPYIPDDKIWITSNGIVPEHFELDVPRNPNKVIYASSPDRGLERVLDAWPMIKEACPAAELHIYYGFNKAFDAKSEVQMELKVWKEKMLKKMDQDGVIYHGMISHKEIASAFLESTVWAYPTPFEEISCITAMKAQAAGAIPVVSRYSAINETVRHGLRFGPENQNQWTSEDLKSWAEGVIQVLSTPEMQEEIREKMIPDALETFGWENVAVKWNQLFLEDLDANREECHSEASSATV